jgi:uncharacterized membrane protein
MKDMSIINQFYKTSTVFFLALYVSLFIPPMQSPDEISHITRATFLSGGQVFPVKSLEGQVGGEINKNFISFIQSYEDIPFHSDKKVLASNRQFDGMKWGDEKVFVHDANTSNIFPVVYGPQALGLLIGKSLNLNMQNSYFLARVLCILCIFLIFAWSFKLYPGNPFLYSILLLPMSIFQFASPTIDGITTALVILSLTIFLNLMAEGGGTYPRWRMLSLTFLLLIIVGAKFYLLPMIFLLFIACFYRRSYLNYAYVLFALGAILFWVVYLSSSGPDMRLTGRPSNGVIAKYYIEQPFEYVAVLYRTFSNDILRNFHIESFIGILGWLDTRLSNWMYPTLKIAIVLAFFASLKFGRNNKDLVIKVALILIAASSTLLVYTFMLLGWSEHPAPLIAGIQGRYFLTPLIIFGYALSYATLFSGAWNLYQKWLGYVATGLVVLVTTLTPWVLYSRYGYFIL